MGIEDRSYGRMNQIDAVVEHLKPICKILVQQVWDEKVGDELRHSLGAVREEASYALNVAQRVSEKICPACQEHALVFADLNAIAGRLKAVVERIDDVRSRIQEVIT